MENKIRIDTLLVEKQILKSRSKAQSAIEMGLVKVNGKTVKKVSEKFDNSCEIELLAQPYKYVSRAGEKLEKALHSFDISVLDKVCLDVGASTGGFTHCMLEHGARKVYAVDVGTSQLDSLLLENDKVCSLENCDIRNFKPETSFDFISVDVSFISLKHIKDAICRLSSEKTQIVMLVKPQFECGGVGISKNGVVKDKKVHSAIIKDVIRSYQEAGFNICGLDYSPIRGGEGNIEFLLYISRDGKNTVPDVNEIVENAHRLG